MQYIWIKQFSWWKWGSCKFSGVETETSPIIVWNIKMKYSVNKSPIYVLPNTENLLPDNLFLNLKLPTLVSGITIYKTQNIQNALIFHKK
jgi:hypothetical protein